MTTELPKSDDPQEPETRPKAVKRRKTALLVGTLVVLCVGGFLAYGAYCWAFPVYEVFSLNGHRLAVNSVAWSFDGTRILSGGDGKVLMVWDAQSGKKILTLGDHPAPVIGVAWSPDNKHILSCNGASRLEIGRDTYPAVTKLWKASGEEVLSFTSGFVNMTGACVAWSPDSKLILNGFEGWVVNAETGARSPTWGISDGHSSVAWSPDGKRIVAGSISPSFASRFGRNEKWSHATIYDAETGKVVLTLNTLDTEGHAPDTGEVISVAWSPDSKRVLCGSRDGTLKVWDAQTGQSILSLEGHKGAVNGVAWSPDGTRILSGGDDMSVNVWDAQNGKVLFTIRGHEGKVKSVAWRPDGKRILFGTTDGTVKVAGFR